MPGFELIGKEEQSAVNEIFEKSNGVLYRYGLDERRNHIYRVVDFETELAAKINVKYCHCVCNGTAALKIALLGLGIKQGDEVITQSFTFIATVEAIIELGAIPVITEIDQSLNMDPTDLEKKITNRTKAIIPVHMAGVAARMDEILSIARKYNIPILEDSAQAFGATYKGKPLGTIGDAGIYSFDIGKVITTGEGGAVVTNNESIYLKAREYADHGHEQNPAFPRGEDTRSRWGFNYKMTELQGAAGLAQLNKLDYILQKQRGNKSRVKEYLKNISNIEFRDIPDLEGDAGDTLIFFLESSEQASRFANLLSKAGIGTKNLPDALNWHYAGTWTHIFYNYPEYNGKDLEKIWSQSTNYLRRAIAIPIMVNMTDEKIQEVGKNIVKIAREV
jgi:8-amino-3,8-dideoxy-alpha-D-manno-octulosonate transaminase